MNLTDHAVITATLEFIEAHRGSLLLHAGGVATADGRTIVVHGASGAGKTTLCAALVAQGLAYLTDETLTLDPQSLRIEPFPKPLTIKPGSQHVLSALRPAPDQIDPESGNWQVSADRVGGPTIPDVHLHPSLIVFPGFEPDAREVDVAEVRRARAAFVLAEQSSSLWAIQPRPLAAIERIVSVAPAVQVSYSDAFAAAATIVEKLETLPPLTSGVPEVTEQPAAAGSRPANVVGPRWADDVDWLLLDGEAVLFDGVHLHHLDSPGAVVWQKLDGSRSLPELAKVVADQYQADPDQVLIDVEDLIRVFQRSDLID